jgi:hypothetical protein
MTFHIDEHSPSRTRHTARQSICCPVDMMRFHLLHKAELKNCRGGGQEQILSHYLPITRFLSD